MLILIRLLGILRRKLTVSRARWETGTGKGTGKGKGKGREKGRGKIRGRRWGGVRMLGIMQVMLVMQVMWKVINLRY